MTDDRLTTAIDIVARHLLARAAEVTAEDDWDLVPEVGEYDWEAIGARLEALAPYPDPDAYTAALEYLEGRASDEESIQAAVERSFLGAPAAQAARATVTDAEAASIVARAQELRDWAPDGHGLAPEAADLIAQGVGGPVHLRLSAPGRHLRTACESGLGGWWTGLASEVTCPICRREADQ